MDLNGLESFLAIVRTGSVQQAARDLGVSRSALRRRLERLEEALGQSLLIRSPRGVSPTAAGQRVLEEGPDLIRRAKALRASVTSPLAEDTRPTVVLAPDGLPPLWVARLLKLGLRALPGLRFDIRFLPDPLAAITEDVDFILHFGEQPPDGPYRTKVLVRVPERLIASGAYLERRGLPPTPEALADHVLLSWQPPGGDGAVWPRVGGPPLSVRPAIVSPDIHVIRALAVAGEGIARVPDPPRFADELGGALEIVLPGVMERDLGFRLLLSEAVADAPRIRAGLGVLSAFLED